MNVLILTGSFGMGHNSASTAIKQDIEEEFPHANVEIIDICRYLFPKLYKIIYKCFDIIAGKCRNLYNFSYKISGSSATIPFEKYIISKINRLVALKKPNIIISTLSHSSKIMSTYKKIYNSNIPLVTCITDISTYSEWVNPNTDIYFVATEDIKNTLIQKGVTADNIVISGIPVKNKFKNCSNTIKEFEQTKDKKLLIMGGGLGLLPVDDNFYEDLDQMKNIKTTIITGNNKTAYNNLLGKYKNIKIVGYSDRVEKYMQEADLIVSKAGGITLFETIHSSLPIFVIEPFFKQEVNNANFIEEQGIGKVIWDKDKKIVEEINALLNNEQELSNMRDKMVIIKNNLRKNPMRDTIRHLQVVGAV